MHQGHNIPSIEEDEEHKEITCLNCGSKASSIGLFTPNQTQIAVYHLLLVPTAILLYLNILVWLKAVIMIHEFSF